MATVTKRDYYDVLGVDRIAFDNEIRNAFRRVARWLISKEATEKQPGIAPVCYSPEMDEHELQVHRCRHHCRRMGKLFARV